MPDPESKPPDGPSWGNISERHWSRARKGAHGEQIEYYRERSRAPGVAEGGAERNFYCMECDGVIPFDAAPEHCPHCGVAIDERVKRYFNWVEIAEPGSSDARALLPLFAAGLLVVLAVAALAWWWLGSGA
ncbi:MAG TPA: hypothetical protein VMT18_15580 [Planctomycetota bacterium]|nr:hypothetical protein [Planctomycetota bacterium]